MIRTWESLITAGTSVGVYRTTAASFSSGLLASESFTATKAYFSWCGCSGVDCLRQVREDGQPTESSVHEDGDKILRGQAMRGPLGGWLECETFAAWSAAGDDPPVNVETKNGVSADQMRSMSKANRSRENRIETRH